MEPTLDSHELRVAVTPPPTRPANMQSTIEEILLRGRQRTKTPASAKRGANRPLFPPPRHPYGVFSKMAERPALAAITAYSLWMVGWGYYLWHLAGEG